MYGVSHLCAGCVPGTPYYYRDFGLQLRNLPRHLVEMKNTFFLSLFLFSFKQTIEHRAFPNLLLVMIYPGLPSEGYLLSRTAFKWTELWVRQSIDLLTPCSRFQDSKLSILILSYLRNLSRTYCQDVAAPYSVYFSQGHWIGNRRPSPCHTRTMATATASSTTSVATNADNSRDSGDTSPTSSPLLFFVALGFGVVFTNLWYAQPWFYNW